MKLLQMSSLLNGCYVQERSLPQTWSMIYAVSGLSPSKTEPDLHPHIPSSTFLPWDWAQLSAFLLNFISALSAATCYLSRGWMTGPLSSTDRANLITGQRGMEGGERGEVRRKEEREHELLPVQLLLSVNTTYKIFTKKHRLYEKCMTSRSRLTSAADRQTSQGSVSE